MREDTAHFENAGFKLITKILRWTFDFISQEPTCLPKLPKRFETTNEYYAAFVPLIEEEIRATIAQSYEAYQQRSLPPLSVELQSFKHAKNQDNPSQAIFRIKRGKLEGTVKSDDVFLIQIKSEIILAIANFIPAQERDASIVSLKFISSHDRSDEKDILLFRLGSVATHKRMYEVCKEAPYLRLMEQILGGRTSDVRPEIFPRITGLNDTQSHVVNDFIHNVRHTGGLKLVQGPPGTGKTTTIIEMLKILTAKKNIEVSGNILVTAPSNQAVQKLAIDFLKACPDVTCVLVGVEERLPQDNPALLNIFIHTWKQRFTVRLEKLKENLGKIKQKSGDKIFIWMTGEFREAVYWADRYRLLTNAEKYISVFQGVLEEYRAFLQSDKVWERDECEKQKKLLLNECTLVIDQFLDDTVSYKDTDALEGFLLRASPVVFATMSVCGRKSLKAHPVKIAIMDEAGQAVEPELLVALQTNPQSCLIVGDPQQLPATVISQMAKRARFDRSLLSRFKECEQPFDLLNVQHRMHPGISDFPNQEFYEGRLKNHVSVKDPNFVPINLKKAPPYYHPRAFIHVNGEEQEMNSSFANVQEAQAIKIILNQLIKNHGIQPEQVGVISFYSGQVGYLKAQLTNYRGITINSVDGFQGGEKDVIIISFVRANPKKQVGFLRDFRRLNVALTRARHSLIMLGDMNTLNRDPLLCRLIEHAEEHDQFFAFEEIVQEIKRLQTPPVRQVGQAPTHIKHSQSGSTPVRSVSSKTSNTSAKPKAVVLKDTVVSSVPTPVNNNKFEQSSSVPGDETIKSKYTRAKKARRAEFFKQQAKKNKQQVMPQAATAPTPAQPAQPKNKKANPLRKPGL